MSDSNTTSKVLAWVGIISAIVMSILTPLSQLEFPEWWASEQSATAIEHEVHEQLLLLPTKMGDKYTTDSAIFDKRIRLLNAKIINLKGEVLNLNAEIIGLKELNLATQKQTDFNSSALSITNEALSEEMDKKKNDCNYPYLETNGGDNWNVFADYYDMRVLYSIDLRSDCRAYYTPIFRSKIKIQ